MPGGTMPLWPTTVVARKGVVAGRASGDGGRIQALRSPLS